MASSSICRKLEIRSYFFEGLYALMTNEERRYFWGKEILAAIGSSGPDTRGGEFHVPAPGSPAAAAVKMPAESSDHAYRLR
jgi:hypothetical protein